MELEEELQHVRPEYVLTAFQTWYANPGSQKQCKAATAASSHAQGSHLQPIPAHFLAKPGRGLIVLFSQHSRKPYQCTELDTR